MNSQFVLEILALLIPLFHLAGLGFAAHATLFTRTSQGAIAWALSLVFFPCWFLQPPAAPLRK